MQTSGIYTTIFVQFLKQQICFFPRNKKVILILCITIFALFLLKYISIASFDNRVSPSQKIYRSEYSKKVKLVSKYKKILNFNRSKGDSWNFENDIINTIQYSPTCPPDSLLIILITSAIDHYDQRNAIRNSWCSTKDNFPLYKSNFHTKVHCIFLIGKNGYTNNKNEEIDKEMKKHGDILRGRYQDVYRNLTIKVLTGLHWVVNICPTKFIFKTDDDCFVNTYILPQVLVKNINLAVENLYLGYRFESEKHTKVIRDKANKWEVSEEDLLPDYYPPYISGVGYLLSYHSAKSILQLSVTYKPFPNEDAYIGFLAEKAQIFPYHSDRFVITPFKWSTCNFLYLVLFHNTRANRQILMVECVLKAIKDCHEETLNKILI